MHATLKPAEPVPHGERGAVPEALVVPASPLGRWLVRLLLKCVGLLPGALRRALARRLGRLAFLLGIRRRVTLENLARAFPEKAEPERRCIARGAYENMALAVCEGLFSTVLSEAELDALLETPGWARFEAARAEGKGVLVATAHFGSWELLGEVLARRHVGLSAVVRPLKGALNAELMDRRVRSGMELIAPRGAIPETLKALRRGQLVAMLIDQALPSKSALTVPFFGHGALTTPALSMAALRSGAPVLVSVAAREGARLSLDFEGPFPVPRTGDLRADLLAHTRAVTEALEVIIRRHPEQWLWLHRRWKTY